MGVNYSLNIGKKVGEKILPVYWCESKYYNKGEYVLDSGIKIFREGVLGLNCRYSYYFEIFLKHKEKINNLVGQKVSFDFIESPAQELKYLEPGSILNSLNAISKALKSNPNEFPYYYSFEINGIDQDIDLSVFIGNEIVGLVRGEDTCYMYFSDRKTTEEKKKVDLRDKKSKEFKCCQYNVEYLRLGERIRCDKNMLVEPVEESFFEEPAVKGNDWFGPIRVFKLLKESVCKVKKKSFYEQYKPAMDQMIKLCKYAKKKGYLVKGSIG